MPRFVVRCLLLLVVAFAIVKGNMPCVGSAGNDDASLRATINQLAAEEGAIRTAAVEKLAGVNDHRILPVLEHYKESSLYLWKGQLVLCVEMREDDDGDSIALLRDVLTGDPKLGGDGQQLVISEADLEEVYVHRRNRRGLDDAIRVHELFAPDLDRRLAAVQRLGLSNDPKFIEHLERVLAAENPARIHYAAKEGIGLLKLGDSEGGRESWMEAARELAKLHSSRGETRLLAEVEKIYQLEADAKPADLELRAVYHQQLEQIKSYQHRVELAKNIFNGISTGSVLVLIALGLAIIFGQMGVINMAHGELVMLGAYATYVTQLSFGHTHDDPNNWFFVAALPISFVVAALAGLLIEFLGVRHLYKRPLESLLATWGVGLILIQFVRAGFPWSNADWAVKLPGFCRWGGFGDNIGVNSPTWLVGAFNPMTNLALPYNRLFIIVLTLASVVAIAVMMRYTRLGLRIRATVQNRETAASLGVNTRRTDSSTFAIGSGLAGIAGYALTLIAGVTPDMGQNYIVDSFLVVVTGGVGKLAGAVSAGTGIGVLNKFFEPISFGWALFSVGAFILVASWIAIALRAYRLDRRLLLLALLLTPLFVYWHRRQRGLVMQQLLMLAGLVSMLLVSQADFDHMVVFREEGTGVVDGQRIVVVDHDGTRAIIQFVEKNSPVDDGNLQDVKIVNFASGGRQANSSLPAARVVLAERLATAINEAGLRRVTAVSHANQVILRGSHGVIFSNQQESLGLASRTPEGFRSKPAQVSSLLPRFGSFLALPVQTIWGKVLVLVLVMMFIQWQPGGLFPPRGRLADE